MTRSTDDINYIEWSLPGTATLKRIYADAWISEDIDATSTITEHAVETGAKINEHVIVDQLLAKGSLFISGSPLRGDLDPDFTASVQSVPISRPEYPSITPLLSPGGITQAVGAAVNTGLTALGLGAKDGAPSAATVLKFDADPRGRLRKVYEQLLALRQSSTLVSVGFSVGRIENLALARVHIGRTDKDGDSGTIEVEFAQLNFVSTQSAAAIPLPVKPRAKPKEDSVTVSADDADSSQTTVLRGGVKSAQSAIGL
jgi:hypothetical protein